MMAKVHTTPDTTNLFFAGIGGQGVLLASEIVAKVAMQAKLDVKTSEVHGMSQRGGSVVTIVRFGRTVHSPLIPEGAADCLIAFDPVEGERHAHMLTADGTMIDSTGAIEAHLPDPRTLNMFILGKLGAWLPFAKAAWLKTIAARVPPRTLEANSQAFELGWTYRERQ